MVWRVLLFLLPFVLYGLWVLYVRRRKAAAIAEGEAAEDIGRIEEKKAVRVAAVGLTVLMLFLALWGLFGREEARSPYVPPHVEGGQIVPGEVKE